MYQRYIKCVILSASSVFNWLSVSTTKQVYQQHINCFKLIICISEVLESKKSIWVVHQQNKLGVSTVYIGLSTVYIGISN